MKGKLTNILILVSIALAAIVWSGCTPSQIPNDVKAGLSGGVAFKEVIKDPDSYQGKRIMWGGQIASMQVTKEGVYMFISQLPVNSSGQPRANGTSEGRFIALADRSLDVAIYKEGAFITVVGVINGQRQLPMVGGFLDYIYPLVTAEHIYSWSKNK